MTLLHVLICTWRRAALRVLLRVTLLTSEVHHPNGRLSTKVGVVLRLRSPRCRSHSTPNRA